MGLSVALLIKGFQSVKRNAPKVIGKFACKDCGQVASVSVIRNQIRIAKCRCVQCRWLLLKSNQQEKEIMTTEQKMRYKELMWIAKEGDYMSMAEFEELGMLIKLNGYK